MVDGPDKWEFRESDKLLLLHNYIIKYLRKYFRPLIIKDM